MNTPKDIIVFAGPSGVGKSTLCSMMIETYKDIFSFAVSATTRPIRAHEVHGVEYFFLSEESFKEEIANDGFVEWEEVYPGRFYGTLKSELERIKKERKVMVLDIDVLGALSIKKKFNDQALIIFVKPESIDALVTRLEKRNSDSPEDIKTRVARFERELSLEPQFDEVIVNTTGELEKSKEQLEKVIKNNFANIL